MASRCALHAEEGKEAFATGTLGPLRECSVGHSGHAQHLLERGRWIHAHLGSALCGHLCVLAVLPQPPAQAPGAHSLLCPTLCPLTPQAGLRLVAGMHPCYAGPWAPQSVLPWDTSGTGNEEAAHARRLCWLCSLHAGLPEECMHACSRFSGCYAPPCACRWRI